jgi:hypothetical protein
MKTFNSKLSRLFFLTCLLTVVGCSGTGVNPPSPESGYRFDNLPDAGKEDAAISDYRAISSWDKFDITFAFLDGTEKLPGDEEDQVVEEAFQLWADQTPLTFSVVSDPSQADIVIEWASGDHGDGDPFDGPGDVLAHSSFPNPYTDRQVFLHFDNDESWVDSDTQNVDLLTVAAHEIGHTLGLDHSSDPNSIMYPSYRAPHRFLSADDIAGIQSLYGMASAPKPEPESPPADVTPPPSQNKDSDGDGLSDQDELLKTGTDPNKADTDGDGLGDGIEVQYRMNPLDPDMDKDGVSDGQEVADGSDPFFPDQGVQISPELEKQVSDFLTEAINLEIQAYRENDATIASGVMAGEVYSALDANIAELKQRGLLEIAEIDYYQSYINDIRPVNDERIEVDTCEVWTTDIYLIADGSLRSTDGPTLLPQTITLDKVNGGWVITSVNFFDPPSFCQ